VWLVIYIVETNARIKGFMSVNGNTGIYGNVVLTLRLSSDRHGSIDNGSTSSFTAR
jgi:hypothetical protein